MELSAFPWLDEETTRNGTIALRNVFLHVTKACNLLCSYCYFSAESHPRYVLIENAGRDWSAKAQAVYDVLANWLAPVCE